MRNVFALAGLAVMAAAVVLGDGGHPYQYETSAGWGDHHHNALVTSRQSPNPLRSRQALAALLTPGVVTAIVSLATAIGVSTAQATAANNRIDDTNRRVGTTESDITKLKKTDTAEAAKVTALETAVGTATTGLTKKVADLETAVGDKASAGTPATGLEKDVADLKTSVSDPNSGLTKKVADNCAKVNSIIAIGAPGALPSTAGTVPQSNPDSITSKILPAGNNYAVSAVTDAGVTPTETSEANGLAAYTAVKGEVNGQDTTALSVTSFNTFRKQVADALNTLDAKIRQVTSLAQVPC